ncbi:hypothetical protein COV11_01410, partial [Candidatus Woesearchaeota archaeon CG10_big_fil_rev_8_21_14_0_10_30_7]
LVIIAGDFTMMDQPPQNLVGPFKAIGKKVLIIHGNHDSETTLDFLSEHYKVGNLNKYAVTYEGVGFFGAGGAEIGPVLTTELKIFERIKNGHKYVKDAKKKVMVTHVHPRGSLIEKFSNIVPSSNSVRKALDEFKPDILICGHVHEAQGIEEKIGNTRVINVSRIGKVFDI